MEINEKNTALHLLEDSDRMSVGIDPGAQNIGGESRARSDLQGRRPQVHAGQRPGQDRLLDGLAPLGTGAVLEVEGVHEVDAVRPGKGGG